MYRNSVPSPARSLYMEFAMFIFENRKHFVEARARFYVLLNSDAWHDVCDIVLDKRLSEHVSMKVSQYQLDIPLYSALRFKNIALANFTNLYTEQNIKMPPFQLYRDIILELQKLIECRFRNESKTRGALFKKLQAYQISYYRYFISEIACANRSIHNDARRSCWCRNTNGIGEKVFGWVLRLLIKWS